MSKQSATGGDVVLEARDLTIEFGHGLDVIRPVDGVDLVLRRGEMLGLVGESGSGKSVTSLAITGLTEYTGGRIVSGSVRLGDIDVLALTPKQRSAILGRDIGMIFQQPRRSLNPTMSVGGQIAESVRRHRGGSRKEAWARAVEMLDRVRIPDAARRAHEMPFSFSGGMAQRVMIAMALACEPSVLVADEPTTALDATVQARVMELLAELQHDLDVAVLLITHDLGVASGACDRIAVMYCGQIVRKGRRQKYWSGHHTRTRKACWPRHRAVVVVVVVAVGSNPSPAACPLRKRFLPAAGSTLAARCPHPARATHGRFFSNPSTKDAPIDACIRRMVRSPRGREGCYTYFASSPPRLCAVHAHIRQYAPDYRLVDAVEVYLVAEEPAALEDREAVQSREHPDRDFERPLFGDSARVQHRPQGGIRIEACRDQAVAVDRSGGQGW